MTIDVRRTQLSEARSTSTVVSDALLFPRLTDEEWAVREPAWAQTDSISSWDGSRCVGHVGAFRFETTVPGGARLATSGVTRVAVLPTHTRRGLLRTMMTQLLTEGREAGQSLASLRASEAVIYQRFGFEVAGESVEVKVTSRDALPLRAPVEGTMRLVPSDELLEVVPPIYESFARRRVGAVDRTPYFWSRILKEAIDVSKPAFVAVHTDADGVDDGYIYYEVRWADRPDGSDAGAGVVRELFGADASVERALWAYLFEIDLIVDWTSDNRPIDEPIRFAARDQRAYHVTTRWDEQWLRILDVDTALTARTYGPAAGSVTIRVVDPMFADNNGTWRIDSTGARREGDHVAAHLVMPIGTLSAAYLGGTSWTELAGAGLLEVVDAPAIAIADALFATHPAPYCGTFF
ncbi:MAG: hypothetical protein JWN62_2343 [Acidimicrobiales bacterium]|nr:hypothetical protein [Acidimicrobiales bacterium]